MNNSNLISQNENNLAMTLDVLIQEAEVLYQQQIAYGTKRAYQSDWNLFVKWCATNNFIFEQATPSIVSLFLTHQFKENNRNPSTINRRLAAIKFWFKSQNLKSPTDDEVVHAVMKGIRRDKNVKQVKPKKATLKEMIMQMVDLCPTNDIRGVFYHDHNKE